MSIWLTLTATKIGSSNYYNYWKSSKSFSYKNVYLFAKRIYIFWISKLSTNFLKNYFLFENFWNKLITLKSSLLKKFQIHRSRYVNACTPIFYDLHCRYTFSHAYMDLTSTEHRPHTILNTLPNFFQQKAI